MVCGNVRGLVSWLHLGGLGWGGHSLTPTAGGEQLPELRPGFFTGDSGQVAPAPCRGMMGLKGERRDQDRCLNGRVRLSNRTNVALVHFPSSESESPASTPGASSTSKTVWECSAGTILFWLLFLLQSLHLVSLLPFFFLSSPIPFDSLTRHFFCCSSLPFLRSTLVLYIPYQKNFFFFFSFYFDSHPFWLIPIHSYTFEEFL